MKAKRLLNVSSDIIVAQNIVNLSLSTLKQELKRGVS